MSLRSVPSCTHLTGAKRDRSFHEFDIISSNVVVGARRDRRERKADRQIDRMREREREREKLNTRGVYGLLLPSRSSSLANRYTTSALP